MHALSDTPAAQVLYGGPKLPNTIDIQGTNISKRTININIKY